MEATSRIRVTLYTRSTGRVERTLPDLPCVMGRSAACDLVIDDPSVSSRHALLSFNPEGELAVRDLGSTNGTTVNGRKVEQAVLSLPAEVFLGNVSLIISGEGQEHRPRALDSPGTVDVSTLMETADEEGCYYRHGGHEMGPYSFDQLREMARSGILRGKDLVWTGKDDNWLQADLVEGLFDEEEPAPPPEPAGEEAKASDTQQVGIAHPNRPRKATRGDIICPHCWHKFDVEDFLYIARHQDLVGDSVLGPEAQQRFLPSKFTPEGHAIDSAGLSCPDMACPRCHLRIPRAAAEMPPLFASIVGAPASGKSYFLTSMMWELRKQMTMRS